MTNLKVIIPVALAAFALLAAGCSSDGDDGEMETKPDPMMDDPTDGDPVDGEEDDTETGRTDAQKAAAVAKAATIKLALDSPITAGADNGVPTEAAAARTADGVMVTLTITDDIADDNPAYAVPDMGGAAPDIEGWPGQIQTRGGTEMFADVEKVTVYTDIALPTDTAFADAATEYTYTWVAADPDADPAEIAHFEISNADHISHIGAMIFPSDPGTKTFDDDDSIEGTFAGASGMYMCESNCVLTRAVTDEETTLTIGGTWNFIPDDGETVPVTDKDYLYFGYWLQMPEAEDEGPMFGSFAGSVGGTEVTGVDGVEGTAEYVGKAGGKYVLNETTPNGDPIDATYGYFTANAMLAATFGGNAVASG